MGIESTDVVNILGDLILCCYFHYATKADGAFNRLGRKACSMTLLKFHKKWVRKRGKMH